jgi:RNA methyltransferase, TrmH family
MNVRVIDSIKDPLVILARELTTGVGRNKYKKFMLFGEEQIQWALQANLVVEGVFSKVYPQFLQHTSVPWYETSEGILKKMSDTSYLVPILGVADYPAITMTTKGEFAIVLDNVVDFGNIGTIIRTAQSFFINTFIFSTNGDPFQKKIIDSSRGLVFSSNFESYPNVHATITALKKEQYQIVVTSPYASALQSQLALDSNRPVALVVGNETHGVSAEFEKQADFIIQIPMAAHVESLNVGVFAGISMYELKFKQVLTMLKEKIFANFGREVNVTGKLMQMAFDKKVSLVTALGGRQVILLMIMHCDETMTYDQIVCDVGLFGDELQNFIMPLIEKKMIQKHENNSFSITDQGKRFLAEIWPIVEQTDQQIFKNFNTEEKQQFADFLQRIQKACTAIVVE